MTNIVEGGPECQREDCMVTEELQYVTLAYRGDNSVTSKKKHCLSCGKSWLQSVQSAQGGYITNWNFI